MLTMEIAPPVPIAELPGTFVEICVDDLCGSGNFPDFDPNTQEIFVRDAAFFTSEVANATYSVGLYQEPLRVVVDHEFVTGVAVSVRFESATADDLGTVGGSLTTTRSESECLSCTMSTYTNLPE
jgi:hypothetical protein